MVHRKLKDKNFDPTDFCLNVDKIKARYSHSISIKVGYRGLFHFLIFIGIYCSMIGRQHRASAVGGANDAFQVYFENLKADMLWQKSPTPVSVYNIMCNQVVNTFLKGTWSNSTSDGKKLVGHTVLNNFHVLGGIIITARKFHSRDCFRGNPCYETYDSTDATDPFYEIDVPSKAGTKKVKVPYFESLGGYAIMIPSSTTPELRQELMTGYQGLFGPDTREIWLHTVVYNPSGKKTVTSVAYGASISVYNVAEFSTQMMSIPYHWYQEDHLYVALFLEIFVCLYAVWFSLYPFASFLFLQPQPSSSGHGVIERDSWLAWTKTWRSLPSVGGRPYMVVACLLWVTVAVAGCFWHFIHHEHSTLGRFGDAELDWLFEDPLAGSGNDLGAIMEASAEKMTVYIWPYIVAVNSLSEKYGYYFFIQVVVFILIIFRLMEYLSFQKRLAALTDTFTGILDELLHMGFVTMLVCFLFGVINCLAFGAYDPAFQYFPGAFLEMCLVCFGLFKPAAGTLYVESLFKYAPHTRITAPFMSWVPVLLQILFKTLVILLLFKLLVGVIMEGYKKHSKNKDKFPTMREDIVELWDELYNKFWYKWLPGGNHVSLTQVALALAQEAVTPVEGTAKDHPWRKKFCGLESLKEVKNQLNCIFEDPHSGRQVSDTLKKEMSLHPRMQPLTDQQVEHVLRIYGTNKRRATAKWAQLEREAGRKKAKTDAEREAVDTAVNKKLKGLLEMQRQNRLAELEKRERKGLRRLSTNLRLTLDQAVDNNAGPSEEEVTKLFEEYDAFNIGEVKHLDMPQLFTALGYVIDPQEMHKVLDSYDTDDDNSTSMKEFLEMLKDDRLIGCYHKHELVENPNALESITKLKHQTKGWLENARESARGDIATQKAEQAERGLQQPLLGESTIDA